MKKIIKSLTVLTLVLLLTGCFEMSEEIWVNPDASSRVKIDLSLSEKTMGFSEMAIAASQQEKSSNPPLLDLEKIKSELLESPSVKKVDTQEYSEAGMRHFIVDVQLRNFRQIQKLSEKMLAASETNNNQEWLFAIEDIRNGTTRFQQGFFEKDPNSETKLEDNSNKKNAISKALLAWMFSDKYITVILHAPQIKSTNGLISTDRRTVTWKIPLHELGTPKNLEANLKGIKLS